MTAIDQSTDDFRRAVQTELDRIGFAGLVEFWTGELRLFAVIGSTPVASLTIPEAAILDLLDAVSETLELFDPSFVADVCPSCVLTLPTVPKPGQA